METITPFKWRHFPAESIFLYVRCWLRYTLSSPDVANKCVNTLFLVSKLSML
jgi:hypothetical protein